ncbi:hypothetical protein [Adlercreutzia rubneri]
MGELVSLFDLGILAKRYWKMIVVLVVAGGLLGAVYSTLNSGVEYQAEATLTPVDPTGAVAPITMMSAVSPIAERLATNAPDDVSLTTSQSEAPTTGSQVLTFVARGKSAEACVNAVNEVASASAVEAAALYAEISEEREEDSIVEKDEKIKIIELLEAQDGISRALDTGFRIDRSFAHVSFQVSEATSAKELAHAGLLEMLLTGALGGAVVAVIVVFLKNLAFRPIKSRSDIESATDLPVLSFASSSDMSYVWANTCYEMGAKPPVVAMVPVGNRSCIEEAQKLCSAICSMGQKAELQEEDLPCEGRSIDDGSAVLVIACRSLGTSVSAVEAARSSDAVILSAKILDDSLFALQDAIKELSVAKAKVAGVAVSR